MNFYIGRYIEPLGGEEAVVNWSRQKQPGVLIIPKHVLDDIQKNNGNLPLEQIAGINGLNYSKGTELEVLALTRKAKD